MRGSDCQQAELEAVAVVVMGSSAQLGGAVQSRGRMGVEARGMVGDEFRSNAVTWL